MLRQLPLLALTLCSAVLLAQDLRMEYGEEHVVEPTYQYVALASGDLLLHDLSTRSGLRLRVLDSALQQYALLHLTGLSDDADILYQDDSGDIHLVGPHSDSPSRAVLYLRLSPSLEVLDSVRLVAPSGYTLTDASVRAEGGFVIRALGRGTDDLILRARFDNLTQGFTQQEVDLTRSDDYATRFVYNDTLYFYGQDIICSQTGHVGEYAGFALNGSRLPQIFTREEMFGNNPDSAVAYYVTGDPDRVYGSKGIKDSTGFVSSFYICEARRACKTFSLNTPVWATGQTFWDGTDKFRMITWDDDPDLVRSVQRIDGPLQRTDAFPQDEIIGIVGDFSTGVWYARAGFGAYSAYTRRLPQLAAPSQQLRTRRISTTLHRARESVGKVFLQNDRQLLLNRRDYHYDYVLATQVDVASEQIVQVDTLRNVWASQRYHNTRYNAYGRRDNTGTIGIPFIRNEDGDLSTVGAYLMAPGSTSFLAVETLVDDYLSTYGAIANVSFTSSGDLAVCYYDAGQFNAQYLIKLFTYDEVDQVWQPSMEFTGTSYTPSGGGIVYVIDVLLTASHPPTALLAAQDLWQYCDFGYYLHVAEPQIHLYDANGNEMLSRSVEFPRLGATDGTSFPRLTRAPSGDVVYADSESSGLSLVARFDGLTLDPISEEQFSPFVNSLPWATRQRDQKFYTIEVRDGETELSVYDILDASSTSRIYPWTEDELESLDVNAASDEYLCAGQFVASDPGYESYLEDLDIWIRTGEAPAALSSHTKAPNSNQVDWSVSPSLLAAGTPLTLSVGNATPSALATTLRVSGPTGAILETVRLSAGQRAIDTSDWTPGVYTLTDGGPSSKRVVVIGQ